MIPAPAATAMTDEQVRDVYHLLDSKLVAPEYGEFFADLVAVTGRPWREVAAIIGATEAELVEGGVNLAECE